MTDNNVKLTSLNYMCPVAEQVQLGTIIKELIHPYVSLERLGTFLYRATFDNIPPEIEIDAPVGFCSSYVADGKLYRNLDWFYNNVLTFAIQCNGFQGTAFLNELTIDNLDDELIGQLPYHVVDGRNDDGIMVSEHVIYNDWDWKGEGEISLQKIPYLLLSQIHSLDNFETQIADILSNVKADAMLEKAEYLLQFLITDGTTTYAIVPCTDGTNNYEVLNITANPKLTNFRWVNKATVDRNELQKRPTGVERWNLMPCDLEDIKFTKAYTTTDRLSEFIGIEGTTKDSTDEELLSIQAIAYEKYLEKKRNSQTWQSVHSVVYSNQGVEYFYCQENFDKNYSNKL